MSKPAGTLASFVDLEALARPLFVRPGVSESAAYYFGSGLAGLRARHALAEIALAAAAGGPTGDVVSVTAPLLPDPPIAPVLIEAYTSAFLFGAWSSVETTVFAANALGAAVAPADFADVDDSSRAKGLAGVDIGVIRNKRKVAHERYFPRYTHEVLTCPVVRELEDHHNASKHREATLQGWIAAMPVGGDALASPDVLRRSGAREIRLPAEPKSARSQRAGHVLPHGAVLPKGAILPEPSVLLSPIVAAWRELLVALGAALRADVESLLATIGACP